MRLFKKIEWPIFDLTVFKITVFTIGLMAGAFLSDFVKRYLWVFAVIAVLGYARSVYFYLIKNK